jgi:hypothetical protein
VDFLNFFQTSAVMGQTVIGLIYCRDQEEEKMQVIRIFTAEENFLKFTLENVIKMKNKPYPALLRTSYLSKEIKKIIQKSRETIPLMGIQKNFKCFSGP